ncbi:unnamed protein product [Lactuca saligna]|uniref:Uncharacterized protein n=1 Tax=Lactuca saligna TaxID=75948 RepID=A0AA36A276_LACSI|nr:unnamed protein product [Lactuca saligna]
MYVEGLEFDLEQVMKEGLYGSVDRVLEIQEFGYGVNKLYDVYLATGKLLSPCEAKDLIQAGRSLENVYEINVDHDLVVVTPRFKVSILTLQLCLFCKFSPIMAIQ